MACENADTPIADLSTWQSVNAILCLVNEQRLGGGTGAGPLTLNRKLHTEAIKQARDAARLKWWPQDGGSIVHQNPERGSEQVRIKDAGYCPDDPPRNENAYTAFYKGTGVTNITAKSAVIDFWMNSDGHRQTMLDPIYNETGIAVIGGIPIANPILYDENGAPILDPNGDPVPPDGGFIIVQTFGFCEQPEPMGGEGWAWGSNNHGQIGDGAGLDRDVPVHPQNYEGMVEVSTWLHCLAVKDDGTAWSWGNNDDGQLGDGTTIPRDIPIQVTTLSQITAVAAGGKHSLALKSDGTVWAWGRNGGGQLGDGSQTDRDQPVRVHGLSGVTAIAAGYEHSLALKDDGSAWGWGWNHYGQLGTGGPLAPHVLPTKVDLANPSVAIAAGYNHSMAIEAGTGQLWIWGNGISGCLGDGIGTASHMAPTPIKPQPVGGFSGHDIIAAGGGHVWSCAVDKQGRVWAWGSNTFAVVAPNTSVPESTTAVQIAGLNGVASIAIGFGHALAVKLDGTMWGWGSAHWGQLGVGFLAGSLPPTKVVGIRQADALAAGENHSLGVAAEAPKG